MIIAIISDTHENAENTKKALEIINEKKADMIIHCGDMCSPIMFKIIPEAFKGPIHCTFGNNDAEEFLFVKIMKTKYENVEFHKPAGELELDGKKIAFTHYPIFGEGLAHTGKYDLVAFGHTHKKHEEKVGDTILINPGALFGLDSPVSFAFYDTETNQITFETI
ncbi:metallophosphoesterase [Patescibacteria group bacterium]|nr:metallophosphoesterase [Patescibacteria group bacterium]